MGGLSDFTAPTVVVATDTDILWPANGKTANVMVSGSAVDDLSGVDPGSVRFFVADEYQELEQQGPVQLDSLGRFSFAAGILHLRSYSYDGRNSPCLIPWPSCP